MSTHTFSKSKHRCRIADFSTRSYEKILIKIPFRPCSNPSLLPRYWSYPSRWLLPWPPASPLAPAVWTEQPHPRIQSPSDLPWQNQIENPETFRITTDSTPAADQAMLMERYEWRMRMVWNPFAQCPKLSPCFRHEVSRSAIRSRGSLFIPLSASQRIQPLRALQRIHLSCLSFPGILQQLLHSLGWTRIQGSTSLDKHKCSSVSVTSHWF